MYKSFEKELKIISKGKASCTPEVRKNRVSENVVLAVEFNRNGKIGQIFAYKELTDGLTENAVKAARNIKFEPVVKNGKTAIAKLSVRLGLHLIFRAKGSLQFAPTQSNQRWTIEAQPL
ncbi:hypothetical protein BH20ACI1_BH20ACI1_31180 [soil metagenome]